MNHDLKVPGFPSLLEWRAMTEAEREAFSIRYFREMREYGERSLEKLAGLYDPTDAPR